MNVTFRPLPRWPYPEQKHRPAMYQVTYSRTLQDLEREIEKLRGSEVIIGVVTGSDQIRMDGRMRADAKVQYPGVEVSFEVPGGQRLVFHTDVHSGYVNSWQDNLRAIALGLESLRAVNRYGITQGIGEQLREALRRNHPDQGGDPRAFADVQAFRRLQGGPA